uniref:Uncharacterized protein n=1 Tax=Arabidopsis thaliana TaxID=3702 RepID=Q0WRU2_ARATH|nr:hypothetical protein [Arabidopsis thaliana]
MGIKSDSLLQPRSNPPMFVISFRNLQTTISKPWLSSILHL